MNSALKQKVNNHVQIEHAQIEQWLAIYPDLSPDKRALVEEHLTSCEACAHIWHIDQVLTHSLHALVAQRRQQLALQPAAQPQLAAAHFCDAIKQPVWNQRWSVSPQPRWLAVAVTLLILIFLSIGLGQVWGGLSLLTPVYATGTPQVDAPPINVIAVNKPPITTPQPDDVERIEIEAYRGIEAALALEAEARSENDVQKVDAYVDSNADSTWRHHYQSSMGIGKESTILRWIEYEISELVLDASADGDLARVRVRITQNSTLQPEIVEGRFYRKVDGRWQLTSSDPEAWGKVYHLETPHFKIEYRELDAELVRAAAGELEAAYQKLLDTLALPQERGGEPDRPFYDGTFHFAIVPEQVNRWPANSTVYTITSPFFHTLPKQADAANNLAYDMLTRVGLGLLDEIHQQPTTYWWNKINMGINQWVLEDSLPNPSWHGSEYRTALVQAFMDSTYPVTMDALLALPETGRGQAAGILLMDYIAAVHGRNEIARFVGSLNQYEAWDDLIPAVFDVTVEEFEASWNGWLRGHFRF